MKNKQFLVRCSCEYSLLVDANTEEEAQTIADETSIVFWDEAWSSDEVEEYEE